MINIEMKFDLVKAKKIGVAEKIALVKRLIEEECQKIADTFGYTKFVFRDVTFNKSAWAKIKPSRFATTYETMVVDTLWLSQQLLLGCDDESVRDTVIHELTHALKDNIGEGHCGNWKVTARILNDKYGYNIKRTTSAKEKGFKPYTVNGTEQSTTKSRKVSETVKARLMCGCCNGVVQYYRRKPSIKDFSTYYHKRCGMKSMGTLHLEWL